MQGLELEVQVLVHKDRQGHTTRLLQVEIHSQELELLEVLLGGLLRWSCSRRSNWNDGWRRSSCNLGKWTEDWDIHHKLVVLLEGYHNDSFTSPDVTFP